MAALPSTRAASIRRFIYLIVGDGNDNHTLHRIDTSPLFAAGVSVGVGAQQAGQEPPPRATLPSPLARFGCARSRQFLPLGHGVEKIVGVDRHRHTVIFDTRTAAVHGGPDARYLKCNPYSCAWAEAGGRLFHLGSGSLFDLGSGRGPGLYEKECLDFEALTYDQNREDWFWSVLPTPPFYRYIDSFADAGAGEAASGAAPAIIRISSWNSSYAFDAARASWRKEGDWALPFHGRAQYVADYGLWFGFTDAQASDLCAVDLNAAGKPACRHVWDNVDGYVAKRNWYVSSYLSYLGSGRFCVTRFIKETDNGIYHTRTAVVTAVEATCAAASATGEMRMVRRASVRYDCPVCSWPCWAY